MNDASKLKRRSETLLPASPTVAGSPSARLSRRDFLRLAGMTVLGAALTTCTWRRARPAAQSGEKVQKPNQ